MFITFGYFLFFVLVSASYFLIPHKWRWLFLLLTSVFLYMTFIPVYIFIMFILIAIDYSAGIFIERLKGEKRKIFLLISILSTCFVLFFFKYFNFFNTNLEALAKLIHWNYSANSLKYLIPLGLSFHTMQSLSYVIEVYRKKQKAEHNFGIYALYVMFFPQLMAGPIERPYNMLHQFYEVHKFDYKRVVSGLRLILWGVFQKVVIADRLASVTNLVYDDPTKYTGLSLIVATVAFSFQIYCDFAGYSHIAIGSARVLGLKLMTNFDRPYFSKSVSEFWHRWHISLSSWFRDYVYIPLGGNRVGKLRWTANILIAFLLSGLWHGANWTFIIWGGLNGVYIIFEVLLGRVKALSKVTSNNTNLLLKIARVGITFSLITFSWIFFRSNSLKDAIYISSNLFNNLGGQIAFVFATSGLQILTTIIEDTKILGLSLPNWIVTVGAIAFMLLVHILQRNRSLGLIIDRKPIYLRWLAYYALILAVIYYSVGGGQEQFIYFQF